MSIVAMASVRGAPGVTTTALAAALVWPGPVLLVEADVCGSSSIKAGHLRGEYGPDVSLINLALAHRNDSLTLDTLRGQTIPLTDDRTRLVLPGLATRAQAANLSDDFWTGLGTTLRAVGRLGVDIIVDTGRLGMRHGPEPLVRDADLLAVVSRTGLDDLVTVRANVDQLADDTPAAVQRCGLILVGEGQPHSSREASKATTLPVWASVAWDPVSAGKINGKEQITRSLTRIGGSRLIRSGRTAVTELIHLAQRRHQLLSTPAPGGGR